MRATRNRVARLEAKAAPAHQPRLVVIEEADGGLWAFTSSDPWNIWDRAPVDRAELASFDVLWVKEVIWDGGHAIA